MGARPVKYRPANPAKGRSASRPNDKWFGCFLVSVTKRATFARPPNMRPKELKR